MKLMWYEPLEIQYNKADLQIATDFAQTELALTHNIRLALALNFSVFCRHILNKPDDARFIANNAISEINSVDEDGAWIMGAAQGNGENSGFHLQGNVE